VGATATARRHVRITHTMHLTLRALAAASVLGAVVSLLRPAHVAAPSRPALGQVAP